jgi:cytosine/adenosine deaminase-related metal-dependent hydrolase
LSAVLIRDCEVVVTMEASATEVAGGSILVEDGVITKVGVRPSAPAGTEVIDGRGCVAMPGLVNTHHHLYQTMTRARAQESGLFDWLKELYPVWASLDAEWVHAGALVGIAELALSGCSTVSDHHYVFPREAGDLLNAEIEAARELGVRFQPCRGSMDLGESAGGLPPDRVVQDREAILADTEAALKRHHDPRPGSMVRIAVGPCSPFSASRDLMRESARLARRLGATLHTHIAETAAEEDFCRRQFGRRPLELLQDLEFLGSDVWLAHCVHLDSADIDRIAGSHSGVAWCPTSNARLGSGIAPVRQLLEAGAKVGLAVDGSASNDGGDLLAECRLGMLMVRAQGGPGAMTAREALRVATQGGAACLGRDDVGSIEAGKRADIALFEVDDLAHTGAADSVAAVVMCAPRGVRDLFVEGRPVVRDHRLVGMDQEDVVAEGRRVARRIAVSPAAARAKAGSE